MKSTTNFKLKKPEGTDPVDVQDLNDNADIIDAELAKKAEKTGAATDMVTAFSQASSRANLSSGEKLSASLGKIMKWFTDLKAVAWSGNYTDLTNRPALGVAASQGVANNLTTTAAGFALDARQGKTLKDGMDAVNQNLNVLTTNGAVTKLTPQADGLYATYKVGADTVTKKLGKSEFILSYLTLTNGGQSNTNNLYATLDVQNFDKLYIGQAVFGGSAWIADPYPRLYILDESDQIIASWNYRSLPNNYYLSIVNKKKIKIKLHTWHESSGMWQTISIYDLKLL